MIPLAKLAASERRSGVEAINLEAAALAEKSPEARRDLEVLATVAANQLALRADGSWVIGIEHPRHARRDLIPTTRPTVGGGGFALVSIDIDDEFCAGDVRWLPLRDGFALLAGPASPEAELERRRAELAERRKLEAQSAADRERRAQEARDKAERFQQENAARIEEWDRLPALAQAFFVAGDRLPEFRPLCALMAEMIPPARLDQRGVTLELPASFKPELAR